MLSEDKIFIPQWLFLIPMLLLIYFNESWFRYDFGNDTLNIMLMTFSALVISASIWLIANYIVGFYKKKD